jgi:hypothetical protein
MERTFTLYDLKSYLQEVRNVGKPVYKKEHKSPGPSSLVLQNLLNYSRALEVLQTNSAGNFFHLAN